MTSAMYLSLADIFSQAAKEETDWVVLWDAFVAWRLGRCCVPAPCAGRMRFDPGQDLEA